LSQTPQSKHKPKPTLKTKHTKQHKPKEEEVRSNHTQLQTKQKRKE
jgi:hypothetical protein